jgi:hypothetical protein
VADLDDDELRAPRVLSAWSMAELVHHLAVDVERFWFLAVMAADPEAVGYFEEATASGGTIPAHLAPSGALDLYRDECAKTDAYLANAAADSAPLWWPTGSDDGPLRISRQCLCTRSSTPRPTPATWTSFTRSCRPAPGSCG